MASDIQPTQKSSAKPIPHGGSSFAELSFSGRTMRAEGQGLQHASFMPPRKDGRDYLLSSMVQMLTRFQSGSLNMLPTP